MFKSKKNKETLDSLKNEGNLDEQNLNSSGDKPKKNKKKVLGLPVWGWVVIILVLLLFIGGSCGSSDEDTKSSASESSPAQEEEFVEETETQDEPAGYVNTAVQTSIYTGSWTVPEDVQPGHYTITPEAGSGNFVIYDETGDLVTNEMLGSDAEYYITNYTTYLEDGYRIEVSGIESISLTPSEPTLSTSKGAGVYIVGQDIPAGSYDATAVSGNGNLVIYSKTGKLKVNEMFGVGDSTYYISKARVSLEDGDVVRIKGIEQVDFAQ